MTMSTISRPWLPCVGLLLLAPVRATAQPGNTPPGGPPGPPPPPPSYYGPPPTYEAPPGPYFDRRGIVLGFNLGLGFLDVDKQICTPCDPSPFAANASGHLGVMLNPRLALLGGLGFTGISLDRFGVNTLLQSTLSGALQYWAAPQVWLRAGLGISGLTLQYDDGYAYADEDLDAGLSLLGAVGYEVFSTPYFAVDLQLSVSLSRYADIDRSVNSGLISAGFSWY
jgi:hypothetical protein